MLNLRILQYYLVVAREESLTQAADILHVSQPTLSRQLHQLEDDLGQQLFIRGSHSIILTEAGIRLCKRAEELLDLAEKTESEFANTQSTLTGEIVIGCGELKSFDYLADQIQSFKSTHSGVTFQIYSGNANQIKQRMDRGLVDIGLLLMPVNLNRYEFVVPPVQERMGILVHKDSPLAKKTAVKRKDLLGFPLIVAKRQLEQGELHRWFGSSIQMLNITAQYNLIYNTVILAQKNLGAVLCLDLDAHYKDIVFVPLEPIIELSSVIVWKKSYSYAAASKAFIEHLQNDSTYE